VAANCSPGLGLPEPWQQTIEASLRLIDELEREISECERELRRLGAEHRYVPLLLTVPGIGSVLAYTIAAEIGAREHDPHSKERAMSVAVNPKAEDPPIASKRPMRAPAMWGFVFGVITALSPLAFWWLDAATVYALGLVLIASVYIGFAVAYGRWVVIAFETNVAAIFVVVAAAAITGSPWLIVLGLEGHGLKDSWQHRSQFVANTRWWPPFCLVVDFVAAAITPLPSRRRPARSYVSLRRCLSCRSRMPLVEGTLEYAIYRERD
jgi:hypothetical protein